MSRKESTAGTTRPTALLAAASAVSIAAPAGKRLGVGMHSYGFHWSAARSGNAPVRFKDALEFLEYGGEIGAGGVQVAIGRREPEYLLRLRGKAEKSGMYLEAQTGLPRNEADLARFEADVKAAREAGADVLRTAMLGGRRYETFDSVSAFEEFARRSWHSLTLAEPVVKKHGIRLAVENHKDWRVPELLDMIQRISSEYVGICVDTGNSIALLEDPMAVIEAYAPWAASTHIKDMGVREYEDGFLLSEVPLGDGFLDLRRVLEVFNRAAPKVRFNLEMITRDPLKIPCLTPKYWATLQNVKAGELAAMLGIVRSNVSTKPLPTVAGLSAKEKLKAEDDHVRQSLAYARRELGS